MLAFVAAIFMAVRTPVPGKYEILPPGLVPGVAYIASALVVMLLLRQARSPRGAASRWAMRGAALLLVAIMTGAAATRLSMQVKESRALDHWPPRLALIRATTPNSISSHERAEWGARIAAHALTGSPGDSVVVPADWPFPDDVTLAVRKLDSRVTEIWSRAGDSTTMCIPLIAPTVLPDTAAASADCSKLKSAPAGMVFARPSRTTTIGPPVPVVAQATSTWQQYRGDATRSGHSSDSTTRSGGWSTRIDGDIRSSVSVVGGLVIVGAHGTGSLTALSLATGRPVWAVRVPNWIHQDAVSDGRIIVVGFGDNLPAFGGRAPSGVAAYEAATGRRLWTSFDEGSVMTSPIIRDTVVIYGTGAGILRKRVLATGRLLGEGTLPGTVTMAPPVSVGDTIVFALDHNRVCGQLISTLALLWCRDVPHLRMMGHSSPAIAGHQVIVSGAATLFAPTLREFSRLPISLMVKLVRSALFPDGYDEFAGQLVTALDLSSGETRWRTGLFASPRLVVGHIAGTATVVDSIGAIVLPISDTLLVFDVATGRTRWTATGHDARGPPLIAGDRVVVAGRDGVIEVRRISDGTITCTVHRAVGYDRAGPTLAGGLAIFANLLGEVEAMLIANLLSCSTQETG